MNGYSYKIGIQSRVTLFSQPFFRQKCTFFSNDPNYQPNGNGNASTQNDVPMPTEETSQNSKRGRPKKSFLDSKSSSKRAKLDPLLELLREAARGMNIHFDHLLYFLGKRNAYQNGFFDEAQFYQDLLQNGIDTTFNKISVERALFLKEKLRLSRNKYETLYQAVEGVFPTRHSLEKYCKDLKVPLSDFMDGKKANFSQSMAKTVERLIEAEQYVPDDDTTSFKIGFTVGFDG